MTVEFFPKLKRPRADPYSAGLRAFEKGEPFDADFGRHFADWGIITAQCLYEAGRLVAAESPGCQRRKKSRVVP
jgi:hypothetical protein